MKPWADDEGFTDRMVGVSFYIPEGMTEDEARNRFIVTTSTFYEMLAEAGFVDIAIRSGPASDYVLAYTVKDD